MSYMIPLLKEMRGRVGMYLGTPSIIRLAAFLRGYEHAMEKNSLQQPADRFLAEFRDCIHVRFGSTSRSWEETILQHSANEEEALTRFWELFDQFVETRSAQNITPPTSTLPRAATFPSEPRS